jgi:hypothetical protein
MQIWRYEINPLLLDANDETFLSIPEGARLLHVESKDNVPSLWAMVEPQNKRVRRRFFLVGTGHEFPLFHGTYVGQFMVREGRTTLVFHLFDKGEVIARE